MKRIVIIGFVCMLLLSCAGKKQKKEFFEYRGFGGGATFIIEYDKTAGNLEAEFNKIFKDMEASVVTSNPTSLINRINRNDSIGTIDVHFKKLLELSAGYYKQTSNAFDPTTSPLENFWGEDLKKFLNQAFIDSNIIDSVKQGVGFDNIFIRNGSIIKRDPHATIDFKNIYKGYMVDLIADVLDDYHVMNYKIEISGRIKAKGTNKFNKPWSIGIDEPSDDMKKRKLLALTKLEGEAIMTAGSWRKYYSQNGKRLPFTIDPKTGYPVKHTLISATVISSSCTEADAYAAAFMVMGTERAKAFISNHPQLKVYLISTNYKGEWITYMSEALREKAEMVKE